MPCTSGGTVNAGSAANIIPENVEMTGTIRSNSAAVRDTLLQKMPPLVQGIASAYETEADLLLINHAPVTSNDPQLTAAMVPALELAAPGKVQLLPACLK